VGMGVGMGVGSGMFGLLPPPDQKTRWTLAPRLRRLS